LPGTYDGDPLEEVELARDEVANMAGAVERIIPAASGGGRSGTDEARETQQYHTRLAAGGPPPDAYAARISYQIMTSVPENWIPFAPAHVPGSVRESSCSGVACCAFSKADRTRPRRFRRARR